MKQFSLLFFFSSVLIATIFFDDPHLFYYKRIIYVVFMGLSIWQLYLFHYAKKTEEQLHGLRLPRWYPVYISLFIAFVLYALFLDIRNPAFSLVTMLNHPLAFLAVVPVFAFRVGYQTVDINIDKFIKFLLVTAILFCLLFILPINGTNIYSQGSACCYAVLPLSLFAMDRKKYRLFVVLLLGLSVVFSHVSESRTIVLRIILFFGLLVAMNTVKKWSPLKILVIAVTGFFIYQFLTNIEAWLELFKSFTHEKSF